MKKVDCLLIGHSGLNLHQIQHGANTLFGDNKVILSNPLNGAISYLGSYLRRRNHTIDCINSFPDERPVLASKLNKHPKVTAVSTTLCTSILQVTQVTEFIRKEYPDAFIVVGGAFIVSKLKLLDASEKIYFMKSLKADAIIDTYQGAKVLSDIIQAVKSKSAMDQINNLIYRQGNTIEFTKYISQVDDLNREPIDWGLFEQYMVGEIPVRTSVSCPFSCFYCSFPENSGTYRNIDVDTIVNQLDELSQYNKVKNVNFIDDTMNIPPQRFKELLKRMIQKSYPFTWSSYIRCQYLDEETAGLMKESRCAGVFLGLESGNQQILDNMNKQVSVEQYYQGHRLLQEYGIHTYTFFIIGFPGETKQTIADTIELIEVLKPTFYSAIPWYCDVSTPIWQQRQVYSLSGNGDKWKHRTMDSKTAGRVAREIKNKITGSAPMHMHASFVIQAMQQGISLENIRRMFNRRMEES